MCVVSMVMESKTWDWQQRYWPRDPMTFPPIIPVDTPPTDRVYPFPTQLELKEFYSLLERAREYDKRMAQPDCEMEEKKAKLSELAKMLGIEINFESNAVA